MSKEAEQLPGEAEKCFLVSAGGASAAAGSCFPHPGCVRLGSGAEAATMSGA